MNAIYDEYDYDKISKQSFDTREAYDQPYQAGTWKYHTYMYDTEHNISVYNMQTADQLYM